MLSEAQNISVQS